ncbi:hypothetical protein RRG08_023124 [Elysia crispata]|uniref:Uncharacterized protein n=1 Tax=Elysia crispata TaxID=231223 RepID=A0AAE1CJ36_9GAST|nr:hypothetical protein RRG08_023124 [Elysia crispata]
MDLADQDESKSTLNLKPSNERHKPVEHKLTRTGKTPTMRPQNDARAEKSSQSLPAQSSKATETQDYKLKKGEKLIIWSPDATLNRVRPGQGVSTWHVFMMRSRRHAPLPAEEERLVQTGQGGGVWKMSLTSGKAETRLLSGDENLTKSFWQKIAGDSQASINFLRNAI